MFDKARLKLTGWYLLIIMFVSIVFSGVIYKALTFEVERFERIQRLRIERKVQAPEFFPPSDQPRFQLRIANPELIKETKQRILLVLVIVNGGIFAISGALAYFLAGRTLKPIKEMVDEQNRFITDASHQLRTPLTSLKSAMEVHLRDKNLTLEDTKTLITQNLGDVNKLQSLSDALLQLAQYEKSNATSTFENVSLSQVVKEAIHKVKPQADQKHIVIKNQTSDYEIGGSKYALIDLLVILLDNAIKYNSEKNMVTITMKKSDGSIVMYVKDDGVGISEKDIPHIFDRFYRGEISHSKTTISGYGLGLSIAKKIVDIHHGSISVESKIKKGTTFIVTLPSTQPVSLRKAPFFS